MIQRFNKPAGELNGLPSLLLLLLLASFAGQLGQAQSGSAWLLSRDNRERESIEPAQFSTSSQQHQHQFASPVQIGTAKYASQLFNGRPLNDQLLANQLQQQQSVVALAGAADLFQCVEPTRDLFESFVQQFNRSFHGDNSDKLNRLNLFITSLRRTITLNRIIQNEILNQTNYELKPEIRNYHFIAPTGAHNLALWYADITDCELGLIKHIVFDIIYLLERNEFAMAYKTAIDNSEYLPLLNEDGFEQLVNILLVRLYDRFEGDEKMNQLFQWPVYLKKLAGYAYNRRQVSEANFNSKLGFITYAYPAYFKDIKYNQGAINRTGDNVRVHEEHETFNRILNRQFPERGQDSGRKERNRRLAIFRQRASLLSLLNDDHKGWRNLTIHPDWLRSNVRTTLTGGEQSSSSSSSSSPPYSAKLQLLKGAEEDSEQRFNSLFGANNNKYRQTQFSDLTDAEFVTFLTNDYSLLANNKESAEFLELNFPIRPLDQQFRLEIAAELEFRRAIQLQQQQSSSIEPESDRQARPNSFGLAKQVVDELISDVGLPIGSATVESISEDDHFNMFNKISAFFRKSYALGRSNQAAAGQPNESEQADERQRRYEQFKLNYGRFKAWFIKEGWTLDDAQMVAMLRLADMSWHEIKLSLFKVCCLTDDNLGALSAQNATIQYLGSNQFLCRPLSVGADAEANGADWPNDYNELTSARLSSLSSSSAAASVGLQGQQQQAHANGDSERRHRRQQRELAALELYYYYSVHFNKHHLDMDSFNRRLAIFARNVDQIRRLSCTRGLTLYRSLKLKLPNTLSTIDVLDPQRSYTDDLNLDRYKYFSVPNLSLPGNAHQQQQATDEMLAFERLQEASKDDEPNQVRLSGPRVARSGGGGWLTRAGVSTFERDPSAFASLLERLESRSSSQQQEQQEQQRAPGLSYADRLTYAAQNVSLTARKYRENSVGRVYDLVMQRYRLCVRTLRNIELSGNELRQQCQSSGPLGDQANGVWAPTAESQLGSAASLRLQQADQCAFYRLGLEPWAEGLIKQKLIDAQLITSARC